MKLYSALQHEVKAFGQGPSHGTMQETMSMWHFEAPNTSYSYRVGKLPSCISHPAWRQLTEFLGMHIVVATTHVGWLVWAR